MTWDIYKPQLQWEMIKRLLLLGMYNEALGEAHKNKIPCRLSTAVQFSTGITVKASPN